VRLYLIPPPYSEGEANLMRRTIVLLAAMAAMVVVYAGAALAASVDELEPNGGYLCCAGAQNIDDYFSLDADPNITNITGTENTSTTVPHATINGTGDGTYDYYSFTVPEGGGIATFDIDGGYNTDINGLPYELDSCLRLFDSLAAEQENNNGFIKANCDQAYRDPGSVDLKDSALEYPLNPGTYYVKVGTYFDNVIEAGAGYKLHVSIPNHPLQVIDDTGPVLSLPQDITTEATGPNGAAVSWQEATATDDTDGSVPVNCDKTSGDTFPLGITTVTCSATDAAGNTASDSFAVTVQNATLPTLSVSHTPDGTNGWNKTSPVTLTVSASDSGSGLAAAPTCTDGSTALTLTAGSTASNWTASVSGDGTHDVSCSVSDNANNSTNASDTVKIDTSAPSISDLGPTTLPNAAGWYKTNVTNRFQATDSSGSGLNGACKTVFPANQAGNNIQSKTTSGEGSALKVTSASCTDLAGNTATGIDSASFKIDKTAPTVIGVKPSAATATDVSRGTNVVATFSEQMQKSTLTNLANFKLYKVTATGPIQITNVTVTPNLAGTKATLNPYGSSTTLLAKNTRYKAVLTVGVKDLAANALAANKVWYFRTVS
jgi:hypothetical protein